MSNRIPIVGEGVRDRAITSYCPHCGYGPLDGYFATEERTPDEARRNLAEVIDPPAWKASVGDMSICAECKALLVFTKRGDALQLRAAYGTEIAAAKREPEFWSLLQKLRGVPLRRNQ